MDLLKIIPNQATNIKLTSQQKINSLNEKYPQVRYSVVQVYAYPKYRNVKPSLVVGLYLQ